MDRQINQNDKFIYMGAVYTVPEFTNQYIEEAMKPYALDTIRLLQERGELTLYEQKDPRVEKIQQAMAENMLINMADNIDKQEEDRKDAIADKKREGRLTYPKITVDFNSYNEAVNAQKYIMDSLRIKNVRMIIQGTNYIIECRNVTDKELDKINKYYMLGKATGALVATTQKANEAVSKSYDYAIKNIMAPITQIGAKTAASITSSTATAVVRTAATAINAFKVGAQKTAEDVITDPEVLKATRELLNVKAAAKKFLNKKVGTTSKGINISYSEDD